MDDKKSQNISLIDTKFICFHDSFKSSMLNGMGTISKALTDCTIMTPTLLVYLNQLGYLPLETLTVDLNVFLFLVFVRFFELCAPRKYKILFIFQD